MIPFDSLAQTRTPEGASVELSRRGDFFYLRVDGVPVMESNRSLCEKALGEIGCLVISQKRQPRILLAGLGLGITLRACLQSVGPRARIRICEPVAALEEWNRRWLAPLNAEAVSDPRVNVQSCFVDEKIRRPASQAFYDAVLLDLENVLAFPDGAPPLPELGLYRDALRSGGQLVFRSSQSDKNRFRELVRLGFHVEQSSAHPAPNSKTKPHTLTVASLPYVRQ